MPKYSFEFKKKVVMEYLEGKGGSTYLAKKYSIKHSSSVKQWIKNYNTFGDDGLKRSRQNKSYTYEEKLAIVELYLSSELSVREVAAQAGIHSPSLVVGWINDFRAVGPDALRAQKKGRKKTLNKDNGNKANDSSAQGSIDTSAEHVKELESELLKLRIENAYLKELRRLRLEEEALLKEKRELSTASEETSN